MYYVYIILCGDDSLYTGIAADWRKRLREHREKSSRCARYTRSRGVKGLKALWEAEDKSAALRLEYRLKRLKAEEKRRLVSRPEALSEFVPQLADVSYRPVPAEKWCEGAKEHAAKEKG